MKGTSWFEAAEEVFAESVLIGMSNQADMFSAFIDGELCNVIGDYSFEIEYDVVKGKGFQGLEENYFVGTNKFTKSFESWTTRSQDRAFSKFVSWVFTGLLHAEAYNITKATADEMPCTDSFGKQFEGMFRAAVGAVGNYGELWAENVPFPRTGMNLPNEKTSGLILSIGLGVISDSGPSPEADGKISEIIKDGFLKCGVRNEKGLATYDETTGSWSGFSVDLCKGISAAIFKGQIKTKIVEQSVLEQFPGLITAGTIDIAFHLTKTIEREVRHKATGGAFDFTPPYFFDGMILSGPLPYGKCASDLIFDASGEYGTECRNTKICVTQGSTWLAALLGRLNVPEKNILITETFETSLEKHMNGECNAIAGERVNLNRVTLEAAGYAFDNEVDYYFGDVEHTFEPISAVSSSGDSQFSDLLRWLIYGFMYAEEQGITDESASNMPQTNLFGPSLTEMWQHAIGAVGNYGQIFERNLTPLMNRTQLNMLNDMSSPMMYPTGKISDAKCAVD